METRNVILWSVVGILVVAIGFLGGWWFGGMQTPAPVVTPNQQTTAPIVKDLSSKVIPSIAAQGKITKIDGRNITLSYQGDSVVVAVNTDARVYAFTPPTTTTTTTTTANNKPQPKPVPPTSKQISFSDLKLNDNVSVNLRVSAAGSLQGFSVVVLPTPSLTK
jgi:cytoskeletal protein RodZ